MRDLPRQLSREELSELFEGDTALVRRLAATENPLGQARRVARELTEDEKLAALRERIRRPRREELDTGVEELCAIAEDRWRNS